MAPLLKSPSKKAFSENVGEMMKAGHPQKQSLAAAYSIKRKAASAKARRMADGGFPNIINQQDASSNASNAKSLAIKKAEGGRIQAPKLEGAMRSHDDQDSEYGKGQPGMPVREPMEDDEMAQQKLPGEMNRRPNGSVKMASYQGEAERYADTSSEMGHFAEGGYIPEKIEGSMKDHDDEDSEYGRGQPGSTPEPMQDHLEEQNMRDDADGIRPGGSIRMASYQDEADRYADSSSEMNHFADGGNVVLDQASKSLHESIMAKHKAKMMADGGDVDIDLNAMEEGEDSLGSSPLGKMDRHAADSENYDAGMKEMYGDDGQDEMHGDSIAERIRRKRMR